MIIRISSRDLEALLRAVDQLPNALSSDYTLRERNALRRVRLLIKRLQRHA